MKPVWKPQTQDVSRMTGKCLIKKKLAAGEGEAELDSMQRRERTLAMKTEAAKARSMVGRCCWNQ